MRDSVEKSVHIAESLNSQQKRSKTVRTRRARKSIEQWSELVEQFDCGSDSMERFCQQQDLAMSTFQRWRSTIRRSKTLGTGETPSGFTRVMPPPAIKPTPLASIPPAITVQVGTSITLTIHTTESV